MTTTYCPSSHAHYVYGPTARSLVCDACAATFVEEPGTGPGHIPLHTPVEANPTVFEASPAPTCTVLFSTGPCGQPAVTTFTTAAGRTYYECADHDASPRLLGREGTTARLGEKVIKTRSQAPYALVSRSSGRLVGYAHSQSPAVLDRARRLDAQVLPITDGKVVVP
jgi:hypothetical protein